MELFDFAIPAHVPIDRVVDFDLFNPPAGHPDPQLAWAELHAGPDIVWTPRNGGHWIATRADDIDVMHVDFAHFSHKRFNLPVSAMNEVTIPLGLDPPEHTPYRKLIMRGFDPRTLRAMTDVARQTARKLVAALAPRGSCEFVTEFAQVMPVNVFLTMAGLPLSDSETLLAISEAAVRAHSAEDKAAAFGRIGDYLAPYLEDRKIRPSGDLISHIVHGEIGGEPISAEKLMGTATLLLLGGLDTVAAQLGFIANFLANSPPHRQQLRDNPRLISFATEELLRRFSIVNTARMVREDYQYGNVFFRKGDMVQLPKSLHGLDDRRYENPAEVDFLRQPSTLKQAAFGAGPHVCPGSSLARREIMIFLEEWLPVVPDFHVDPERPAVFVGGTVNTVGELHLRW